MKYTDDYRRELDELCKNPEFINANIFDRVKDKIPNTLLIVGSPDTPEKQVNCHGYTFQKDSWYEVKNVHEKINSNEITQVDNPQINDIVVYYLNETSKMPIIKHTGRYIGEGKVRSKWASGPVFEHEIFNVPFTYGSVIKYFRE